MYFCSDFKQLINNKFVKIFMIMFCLLVIIDPFFVYWRASISPIFYEEIGSNPFQFWLLISSSGFGRQVFNVMFWILPILFSGLNFYFEQTSSVGMLKIIRKSKNEFFLSKSFSSFLFIFCFISFLLLLNVIITYCIFPNSNEFTEQYKFYVPVEGTFAYSVYLQSPFLMAVVYCLLNSFSLALISIFYLDIQMIVKFKNQYTAIAVPVILLYSLTFIFDSFTFLWRFDLRMIIQPLSSSLLTEIISSFDVFMTFVAWIIVDIILFIVGLMRNKDVL